MFIELRSWEKIDHEVKNFFNILEKLYKIII